VKTACQEGVLDTKIRPGKHYSIFKKAFFVGAFLKLRPFFLMGLKASQCKARSCEARCTVAIFIIKDHCPELPLTPGGQVGKLLGRSGQRSSVVEQGTHKPLVTSSNLVAATIFLIFPSVEQEISVISSML
jgi:hypothetical protein